MMASAMTQHSVTFQQVTVSEAAGILGVSTQTVRRMLRRGQLEGERVHRAQGSAYVVRLPVANTAGDTDATATRQPAPNMSRSNATGQAAPAEAMASLIQTTIATVLGPLVAELAASRQTIERQAETIREQAETVGGLPGTAGRPGSPEIDAHGLYSGATRRGDLSFSARLRPLAPWLLGVLAISIVLVLLMVR
jgi:excisionase family DNA binding protein